MFLSLIVCCSVAELPDASNAGEVAEQLPQSLPQEEQQKTIEAAEGTPDQVSISDTQLSKIKVFRETVLFVINRSSYNSN